ncbi:MAG TPA: FAD-binding protein, partial [Gammaproteobacteria bacterium]|nr:FAD-binding protein [Gammaproteobacteria bacterium]
MHSELYREFEERVISARQARQSLVIEGGNSKHFYGRSVTGDIISTQQCSGIIAYEPTELVVTAFAGTPLNILEKTLVAKGQRLAFEPPCFTPATTIGGVIASGLAGPARPYLGSVRDYVLGVKCLTGRAEVQTFGGQVMKNVAGYDVSRLMTGAMGTLGLLLEISVKVM